MAKATVSPIATASTSAPRRLSADATRISDHVTDHAYDIGIAMAVLECIIAAMPEDLATEVPARSALRAVLDRLTSAHRQLDSVNLQRVADEAQS